LLICFFSPVLLAQNDSIRRADSLARVKRNNHLIYSAPRKASIMSAIVPGLGQVYNRKYWKVPIVYAGIGGFAYLFYINNGPYYDYRRALRESDANGTNKATINGHSYSTEDLKSFKDQYGKLRSIGAIGIGIFYLLNIIDANVDAHLRSFDVSDDLGLQIRPWGYSYPGNTALGLQFKLNFR
jgi:hypothetical protein